MMMIITTAIIKMIMAQHDTMVLFKYADISGIRKHHLNIT